ncbi:uncharacterized protein LOC124697541 [Lolium rigidum]|uniref:uncharacterized protein LOC124697541 n=1 Tax=Lolium rigidum TaxID=89674 RepID=UPI001F5CF75E|nr:uncharacterized protein LOC124697541 [Lolium rigidum]
MNSTNWDTFGPGSSTHTGALVTSAMLASSTFSSGCIPFDDEGGDKNDAEESDDDINGGGDAPLIILEIQPPDINEEETMEISITHRGRPITPPVTQPPLHATFSSHDISSGCISVGAISKSPTSTDDSACTGRLFYWSLPWAPPVFPPSRPPHSNAASVMGEGPQKPPGGQRVIPCDVEPAPRACSGLHMLALATILVLWGLKFLSATHFCHPAGPGRNWIPLNTSRHPADVPHQVGSVDIFSWISCMDLRTLAVLTNSTLSSSSDPHDVSFTFLIPEGGNDQLPFYKIISVIPGSNLTVTSQKKIKDKLNVATPEGNFLWSFRKELSPIIIATHFSRKRHVYISADSIVKGTVEDLVPIDLGSYAISAAEDCSKRLGDYISTDVLSAVQRTAPKGLVYTEPFDKDRCLLDFDVLIVEPHNLKRNLIDSIVFWAKAVNLASQRDNIRLAMTLAFYDDYLKLPTYWNRANANTDILYYDGPKNVCSEDGHQHEEKGSGEAWQQYLSQKSNAMLST